ncbi:DNA-binding protein [Bradyrhizobium sp. 31Argb]|uniref:DNA-binding protein n=1 Tax=Bradyrhizobium sp. 31Argb TaxID=3141247 RepID=UPI00374A3422
MFLCASEMAGLPEMPGTERGVRLLAARSGWAGQRRAGTKATEYPIDVMPPAARAAYVGSHIEAIDIPTSVAREAASEPDAVNVKGHAATARDARLAVIALADKIARDAGIGHKRADQQLCDLYATGQLELAGWISEEIKSVTPRTLARWRAHAKAGQKSRLAVDRAAARRGTGGVPSMNDSLEVEVLYPA